MQAFPLARQQMVAPAEKLVVWHSGSGATPASQQSLATVQRSRLSEQQDVDPASPGFARQTAPLGGPQQSFVW